MKKKEESRWQRILLIMLMLLLSTPAVGAAAYLYGKSFRDMFTLIIMVAACFGAGVF